ncbi:hypothetical protein FND50_33625 [Rhodococcus sp. WB9]|nr:hypothetical protein FND50_33625 [Rhodococcus sp. WB9]
MVPSAQLLSGGHHVEKLVDAIKCCGNGVVGVAALDSEISAAPILNNLRTAAEVGTDNYKSVIVTD